MADDISLAEVARRLDDFRRDVREDLAAFSARQDLYVQEKVYRAEKATQDLRLTQLEQRVKDGEDQRRALSRYLISAVIIPIVSLIATVVFNLVGPS